MDLFEYDRQYETPLLCGVDEAGRGPLAGDVYAAACILPNDIIIEGLNDSKKLSEKKREQLYSEITQKAIAWAVGVATVEEIEKLNILNASFLAMQRAVEGLSVSPSIVLVDGNRNPRLSQKGQGLHSLCVVKGDSTSASIAAASVLAKVSRDRYMQSLAQEYPQYQFDKHKGYGTKLHYEMLDLHGVSEIHRKSFLKKYFAEKSNPSQTAEKGKKGENSVCRHLKLKGYKILERNYHSKYGEIDIIAAKGDIVAFVEVKARAQQGMGTPREAVSQSKQGKIVKTACCYIRDKKLALQPRFDVAEVILDDQNRIVGKIKYFQNAYDVGEIM